MRPTRRGGFVAAVAALGLGMGATFGARSLDAVVVPAVALLAVSAYDVLRADLPRVRRDAPATGFPGESPTVTLTVASERSVPVVVADDVRPPLEGDARFRTVADGDPLPYALSLSERGVHEVGPVHVTLHDTFGLWARRHVVDDVDEVVVFPPVSDLREGADLLAGESVRERGRGEFDALREYRRGDTVRDVNWKASAKRGGDLVVTEYAEAGATRSVTVGLDAGPYPDAGAAAAASVACHLLDAGVAVGLQTTDADLAPAAGRDHRTAVLAALARYDGTGTGLDLDAVDVAVRPGGGGARIQTARSERRFAEVAADRTGGVA